MLWNIIIILLLAAGLAWLAWISVQSIRQGMLLDSLPKGNVAALDEGRVAIHGTVKILAPLDPAGLGPCLWCRIVQKELDSLPMGLFMGRRRWKTVSDQASMARFAICVGGGDVEIVDLPTEVQGTSTRTESDSEGLSRIFSFDNTWMQNTEFLPLRNEATVIGRLERRGSSRVVVADPELGLLLSPHPAEQAARIEWFKGLGGILGVIAGTGALLWLIARLPH